MIRLSKRGADAPGFARPDWMPDALFRLLSARGISSEDEAVEFLSPDLESLHDPMALSAMDEAIAMIAEARQSKIAVCIYGDYDVDGVCATGILRAVLGQLGLDVRSYIPSRHDEGYGLNDAAIREIAGWAGLMITVDCGVTAVEQVDLCHALGLPVIVTDHHQPGEMLPDCPVVNPLLDGYPFPSLCGAGVALKLAMALDYDKALLQLDLAALATVADVVPLMGENRIIVAKGLELIRKHPRPGLGALAACANMDIRTLRAGGIAFGLGPRLNAGGRLGDANRALDLLMAGDTETAQPLADTLEAENASRRGVESQILVEARAQMEGFDFINRRAIVLRGRDWNAGVVGLAASRLVEQYHMPTIMLTGDGDELSGSCRSIPGVDIHQALTACAALLVKYGGHKQAAGLTLKTANLDMFVDTLNAFLMANADPGAYVPSAEYDIALQIPDITDSLVTALSKMEPFGFGNPAPVVLTEAKVVTARPVGTGGAHLSMRLTDGEAQMGAIGFRMGKRAAGLSGWLRLLHQPKINEFNGTASIQMELKEVISPAPLAVLRENDSKWAALSRMFLTERVYNWAYSDGKPAQDIEFYAGAQDIARLVGESPYGTLVVATDEAALGTLIRSLDEMGVGDRYDLLIGRWPDGAVPTNAVCALPMGEVPRGYKQLVMLDAPAHLIGPVPMQIYAPIETSAAWLDQLPDVDALRTLYIHVKDMARRPMLPQGMAAVLASLSRDDHDIAAAVGLPVLHDMGLIELDRDRGTIKMLPVKKADPAENRVYKWIKSFGEVGG